MLFVEHRKFTAAVQERWGIRAIQIHIHRDEGHYEENERGRKIWVPNYHAHIVWDWMDHTTGKSYKLSEKDMSEMQDMLADMLKMERGQKKSETGLDHLERNDFILQKQEKEKKQLEEEKRKAQSEKAKAENKANVAKEEAEQKTKVAKTALSSAESKITEKQAEIDRLEKRITSKEAVLDRLITETRDLRFAKYSDKSAGSDGWKDSLLSGFSANTMKAYPTIGYCVDAIKDYACSGTGCRGGSHGSCFWDEEASAIKKVMTSFATALQATLREVGAWLVWLAHIVYHFNERELYRADNEVKDVADGQYDWRIDRIDRGRGGGMSR